MVNTPPLTGTRSITLALCVLVVAPPSEQAKRLHIEAADPQLARAVQEGWLYITVCAYATPSGASVSFSLECKPGA
jgi:hypothetical protein